MKTPSITSRQRRSGLECARSPIRQPERYRSIVAEFEAIVGAKSGETLSVAAFCAAVGVSQRTVRRAFRAVHGVSPSRYLQSVRLLQAREMLLSMTVETGTVTQIAMRLGFGELGRFAALYRRTFGESPSATLSRNVVVSGRRHRPGNFPAPSTGFASRERSEV
jgi:transcriptional regulator GlxA family with amidase domain